MSALEMSSVSGTSSEIEDEEIDVDSDPSPIDTDFHRHPHQQHPHPRGHQLQKPNCSPHLRLSFADRPSLQQSMESEDRIRKRSSDKAIAQSAPKLKSHSKHVLCSTTELQSLLSTTAEDPIISSDKRFFGSPPSVVDRSPSSGVSSSSSSSSSAASSPPSSPHHQKHHLPPTTVPSLVSPSSLSSTKSGDAFQQSRLSCPSNPSAVVVPRSAPAPVTNFFIEEILKPSFGVSSSKFVQVPTWVRSTWVRGGSQVLSPDLIKRNELPPRSGLPLQKYEHFPISSIQETKEAHMTKKRKQSKLSQNSYLRHRVDLERNDPKLPPRVIGDLNTRNTGVPYKVQSPDSKSSTRYQALPLLDQSESGAFKLVTCSLASAPNDCSNSNSSSSNGSSQTSGSLPEEGRRSEDSDQPLHLSDPSSASSGSSSSCFQSQQLPAWVYCTRYSDRPSSGPRSRKVRTRTDSADDKRPRTAFTNDQLQILKREFSANQYLNEDRRNALAAKLNLNETQIKIWFQNKRAKLKKTSGTRNRLALELMAQGLYNHSTVSVTGECG